MKPKTVRTVAIVLIVVAAIAAASTLAYFLQMRRVEKTKAQLSRQIDSAPEQQVESSTPPAPVAQTPAPEAEKPKPAESDKPSGDSGSTKTTRQFAYVREATEDGGAVVLKLDYADFLTGDKAAAAAAAAGDESPPPNDYYISNTNGKLRTLTVKKGAKFVVAGFTPEETTSLSATQFLDAIQANTDGAADAGYWFVITGTTVESGEEQWTP